MTDNRKESIFCHNGVNYLIPFLLISSLFFMWGFAHSILEVLNPHFQQSFQISKTMAAFVQVAVYGAYFLMALPAGLIIRRFGYRAGVITGLLLYGIGALLFIPGSMINSYWFFIFSLFVIGCGLTCLETSANPYTTVLGDPDKAESRINLSQSLNGLGWMAGPFVGGALFSTSFSIAVPYTIVGVFVLVVCGVFCFCPLPEIREEQPQQTEVTGRLANVPFLMGMAALFLYVAAQTGVNSFFVNYMTERASIPFKTAALWLSIGGMGFFFIGRLVGGIIMNKVPAKWLLAICALVTSIATYTLVSVDTFEPIAINLPSVWHFRGLSLIVPGALKPFLVVYLCESIMFPTIFSLALRHSNGHTKMASSLLIMTILGGAVAPLIMGRIADLSGSMAPAFIVPLVCYVFITFYGLTYHK